MVTIVKEIVPLTFQKGFGIEWNEKKPDRGSGDQTPKKNGKTSFMDGLIK